MRVSIKKSFYVSSLAIIGIASFNTLKNYNANLTENDLLLSENVLALADGTWGNVVAQANSSLDCYNSVTCDGGEGESVRYCSTCTPVPDSKPAALSGTGKCVPSSNEE